MLIGYYLVVSLTYPGIFTDRLINVFLFHPTITEKHFEIKNNSSGAQCKFGPFSVMKNLNASIMLSYSAK